MGVDETSLERIRNATFPSSRRGYDKREVEKFLSRLADWLETGGGDESRSDTVKRELERVGQRTGAILAQAEESAEQIRAEAEEESRQAVAEANSAAEQTRSEADSYSKQTRSEADGYAKEARGSADTDAKTTRNQADQEGAETVAQAQAQARRIVEEGNKRRQDIESVIADLVGRRDAVLGDIEELSGKLDTAVAEHRPPADADPFDEPEEYDPLDGEAEEVEEDQGIGEDDDGLGDEDDGLGDEEDAPPEPEDDEDAPETAEQAPPKKKGRRRRSRRRIEA
jgi:DivIVA domain-containing protein